MKRQNLIFLFLACACPLLLSACGGIKPMDYEQYYNIHGERFDLCGDAKALPLKIDGRKSNLSRLLEQYPFSAEQINGLENYRIAGFYCKITENSRSWGSATGDLLNTAAWHVLRMNDPALQKEYAEKIKFFLLNPESDGREIYSFCLDAFKTNNPNGKTLTEYYDDAHRFLKSSRQFSGSDLRNRKKSNPNGLQRFFYENGMIREEFFSEAGSVCGEKEFFREDGRHLEEQPL